MKLINDRLTGSDPEVFLVDKKSNNFISAIGKIGGTKRRPKHIRDGFFVQEDNVLAEFNIPPASTKDEFVSNIGTGLSIIQDQVKEFANIAIQPYAFFEDDELRGQGAMRFGCSPDKSCWSLESNPMPMAKNHKLRTAGGHISIGYRNPSIEVSQILAQALDLYLGVPSTIISSEAPRRELYGTMGAVRFKEFGLEYRTLSNFWLANPDRVEWAYDQVTKAIEFIEGDNKIDNRTYEIMKLAIDGDQNKAAEYLISEHNLELVV